MVTSEQSRNEQVLGDWGVQEYRLETRARHRYGRRWPPSLRSGGVLVGLLSLLALVGASPVAAAAAQITEFPVNVAAGNVLVKGGDGALWFVSSVPNSANGEIGRITTAGQISRIHDPVAGGNIYQLTSSSDGSIWFLEGDGLNVGQAGRVGHITKAGQINEFTLPQVDRGTHGVDLTADPAGNLWFTANIVHSRTSFTGEIGRITPSGQLSLFPTPTAMSLPQVILMGPDGNLWFTEENVGVGRITSS